MTDFSEDLILALGGQAKSSLYPLSLHQTIVIENNKFNCWESQENICGSCR